MRCSMLQCVAGSVLQCVAVCCGVLQSVAHQQRGRGMTLKNDMKGDLRLTSLPVCWEGADLL